MKPGRAIDLRLVAETIDVDVETLRALNPSLLRMATPDDPEFVLHLPKGTARRFSAEIADIPADKWVSWRRHRVEEGETLTSIAKKYRVTAAAIAAANDLESRGGAGTGGETDYSGGAADGGDQEPTGAVPGSKRGHAGGDCRPVQRDQRQIAEMERPEGRKSEPRHGVADLYGGGHAGGAYGAQKLEAKSHRKKTPEAATGSQELIP